MARFVMKGVRLASVLAGLLFAAGCATTDQSVNMLYQPVISGSRGTGDIVLAVREGTSRAGHNPALRWVIGSIASSDGEKTGEIVAANSPGDMMLDALQQELTAAGYTVSVADALPPGVSRGVDVTKITVELQETPTLLKLAAKCHVKMTADLVKNGNVVDKVSFESRYADVAIKDRDLLLPAVLQKGLQNVMKQAVPAIITSLGK
ncbi:MAG: hypothetical protein CXR31_10495 [Geobacter sp.]|nr:MAG: hypothetical protein CXR31_10495 [Geobacter sp.]